MAKYIERLLGLLLLSWLKYGTWSPSEYC